MPSKTNLPCTDTEANLLKNDSGNGPDVSRTPEVRTSASNSTLEHNLLMTTNTDYKEGDMAVKKIDYDEDILSKINGFGRWQLCLFAILWLPSAFSAFAVFMYSFIAYTPPHHCAIPSCGESYYNPGYNFTIPRIFDSNDTDDWQYEQCVQYSLLNKSIESTCQDDQYSKQETEKCTHGWVADTDIFTSTATIDLGMVCDDQWKKSFAQSLYMAGMLVGSFAFGTMADWIGRKITMAIGCLFLAASGTACALLPASPDMYIAFCVLRFFAGAGHVGTFMMSFTLSVEYIGRDKQAFCGCLIEIPFASGGLLVGILSWAGIRNWRILMLVLSTPAALLSLLYFILPESPRWLLAKGKIEQLDDDVRQTAKFNNTSYPAEIFDSKNEIEANKEIFAGKATLVDLFRPMTICTRTIVMFYNWLVTTLCYYGLTMVAADLSENIFLNYSLVILVEIPAIIACTYAMDKWGRKPCLAYSQILAGITCVIAGFLIDYDPMIPTAFSIVGKFGATASFAIVFVYTAEMFPTEIRSSAVGSSSTCARIGGVLAPQVANLDVIWKSLPLLVMGGSALIGGILALIMLPETLGKALPETMEDAVNLGKRNSQR